MSNCIFCFFRCKLRVGHGVSWKGEREGHPCGGSVGRAPARSPRARCGHGAACPGPSGRQACGSARSATPRCPTLGFPTSRGARRLYAARHEKCPAPRTLRSPVFPGFEREIYIFLGSERNIYALVLLLLQTPVVLISFLALEDSITFPKIEKFRSRCARR